MRNNPSQLTCIAALNPTIELVLTMPKKNEIPVSFENSLAELEQIVQRLESGDLPLDKALNEFERGVKLARTGQQQLQQAEQRVKILLSQEPEAELNDFTTDQ